MIDAIYIHIPFCVKKCNYCDFLSFSDNNISKKQYVDYLIKEIKLYPKYQYNTIYFGGGTPSLLDSVDIKRILKTLNIASNAEITLEVNPNTVTFQQLKKFCEIGINRLSIGIQSFNNKFLSLLGRIHNENQAITTFFNARKAGFNNISLDLMFALPTQKIEEVEADLIKLFKLKPEHFSIYSLIWEEGTPFFDMLKKKIFRETENDLEAEMYEKIITLAEDKGYVHYEISNFSLPNMESQHNSKYWKNKEYVGIGLGASGYINGVRYKNLMQFYEYYDRIDRKLFPVFESEKLSNEEIEQYKYILGFRLLKRGVFPTGKYLELCKKLENKGFLILNNNRYILSHKGLMFANDVINEFI